MAIKDLIPWNKTNNRDLACRREVRLKDGKTIKLAHDLQFSFPAGGPEAD